MDCYYGYYYIVTMENNYDCVFFNDIKREFRVC